MTDQKSKVNEKRIRLSAAALVAASALTLAINFAAYFFLPGKIATSLRNSLPDTSSAFYLAVSALLIGLSSAAGTFQFKNSPGRAVKYLFITAALFTLNAVIIIKNL